jgi:hypothetical protein
MSVAAEPGMPTGYRYDGKNPQVPVGMPYEEPKKPNFLQRWWRKATPPESQSPVQPATGPNFVQRLLNRTPPEPPRFMGSLDLSEPQEYSRERLISEWLNEYDVYSKILDGKEGWPQTTTISGAIDSRVFDLLTGKVTASFDPMKGKLDEARTSMELDRLNGQGTLNQDYIQLQREQLQGQLSQMRHEREILSLKQANELAQIRAQGTTSNTTAVTAPSNTPTVPGDAKTTEINQTNAKLAQMETSLSNLQGRLDTLLGKTNELGIFAQKGLNNGQQVPILDKNTVESLPLDKLRDLEAVRNGIISLRRKKMLDDTHDRMGSNLHHLHYRLTMIPPEGEDRLCKVEARLMDITYDYAGEDAEHAKNRYLNALAMHMRRELDALDDRLNEYLPMGHHELINSIASTLTLATEAKLAVVEVNSGNNASANKAAMNQAVSELTSKYGNVAKMLRQVDQESLKQLKTDLTQSYFQTSGMPLDPPQGQQRFSETLKRKLLVDKPRNIRDVVINLPGRNKALLEKLYLQTRYGEFLSSSHSGHGGHVEIFSLNRNELIGNLAPSSEDDDLNLLRIESPNEDSPTWKSLSLNDFARHFHRLRRECAVIAVEPSEYAQNISSVAAYEKLRSFMASITAAFSGGASLGGEMQSLIRSQKLLDSIQRKPLAVGFIHSKSEQGTCGDRFGWYLGPRFEIREKKGFPVIGRPSIDVAYSHAEAVYDLEFTVVTPALAREVKIEYTATWIDPKTGEPDRRLEPRKMTKTLRLTPDYDAFINGILQHREGTPSGPLLSTESTSEVSVNGGYDVVKGNATPPETVVVTTVNLVGSNLWRSPEVYLDGLRARNVKIDPDMRGLRAEFATLPRSYDRFADLTVVTSTGRDNIPDFVRILATGEQAAKLEPPRSRSYQAAPVKEQTAAEVVAKFDLFLKPYSGEVRVWDYSQAGVGTAFHMELSTAQRPKLKGELIPITWSARLMPVIAGVDTTGLPCTVSAGYPLFELTPTAALKGVDGFNTQPPVIELSMYLLATVSGADGPIKVGDKQPGQTAIFFKTAAAKSLHLQKPSKAAAKPGESLGRLGFLAQTDRSLFLRAYSAPTEAELVPAALQLRVKDGNVLPVKVTYEPDEGCFTLTALEIPETKPAAAEAQPPQPPQTAPPAAPAPKVLGALTGTVELVINKQSVIPVLIPAATP